MRQIGGLLRKKAAEAAATTTKSLTNCVRLQQLKMLAFVAVYLPPSVGRFAGEGEHSNGGGAAHER